MNSEDRGKISIRPLESVWVRRGKDAVRKISSKMLVPNIKAGKPFGDDEVSGDCKSWIRLERHSQLSHYFKSSTEWVNPEISQKAHAQLEELAGMLEDLNS